MGTRLLLALASVAALLAAVATGTGTAAPPIAGCAGSGNTQVANAGVDGWDLYTIPAAVQRTTQQIPDANYELIFGPGVTKPVLVASRLEYLEGKIDRNGDGMVCMAVMWGNALNPNSHWAKTYSDLLVNPEFTESFPVHDDNWRAHRTPRRRRRLFERGTAVTRLRLARTSSVVRTTNMKGEAARSRAGRRTSLKHTGVTLLGSSCSTEIATSWLRSARARRWTT